MTQRIDKNRIMDRDTDMTNIRIEYVYLNIAMYMGRPSFLKIPLKMARSSSS